MKKTLVFVLCIVALLVNSNLAFAEYVPLEKLALKWEAAHKAILRPGHTTEEDVKNFLGSPANKNMNTFRDSFGVYKLWQYRAGIWPDYFFVRFIFGKNGVLAGHQILDCNPNCTQISGDADSDVGSELKKIGNYNGK
ncbi:hypothetical protein [Leptospirillum ferriphilum]|uniref:hypothetical protein n=1 Tax=Leptospirillum ferriphilum TaxID=178606 RepID=UPI00098573A9|nr:hypothetical protein [Leptospirillum ferriphilum]OOH79722.1 hypothetical protein BOX30_06270 [Leptospirillum ferriphilum]